MRIWKSYGNTTSRACFKGNSSLHISSGNFRMTFFGKKILLGRPKIQNNLFRPCTNSLSSLHILSNHCTFCASLHVKTSPDNKSTIACTLDSSPHCMALTRLLRSTLQMLWLSKTTCNDTNACVCKNACKCMRTYMHACMHA